LIDKGVGVLKDATTAVATYQQVATVNNADTQNAVRFVMISTLLLQSRSRRQ
jgi:hypothetical protein